MSGNISSTLGAVFAGTTIAGLLTGVVCAQVSMYFSRYQRDKTPVKLMAFAVWLLDLSHTVLVFVGSWTWLIENFGNTDTDKIPPTVAVSIVITALITIIVHGFFIARVYLLSGSLSITIPLVILGLLRVGSACTTCSKMLLYGRFSLFLANVAWVFTLGLSTSCTLDILLTGIVLYYLRKSKTGFSNMDHVIDTLSLYTVQSGLITTIAIVISLGFWIGMSHNLVFLAMHFMISKLYANSFLATLNSRDSIRDRHANTPQEPPSILLSGPFRRPGRNELAGQAGPNKNAAAMGDTIDPVMGDIDMSSFSSKSFRVGRLSLELKGTREVELDCKLSARASV